MRALVVVGAMLLAQPAFAQSNEKYTGSNVDVRTILSFKTSDAAVAKMLPDGWEVNSPATGPAKGSNLGITLIDQVTVQDAEGKPAATFRGAVFTIPAKKKGTDTTGTMVFTGLMSPGGAPGAYGVYVPAKAKVEREVETEADGKSAAEEKWEFKADDGSSVEVKLEYERGPAVRSKVEAKVFSAAKPDFYRIYRFEQASDVARSTATGVDRVGKISVKGTGEKLAPLFDGTTDQRDLHPLVFPTGISAGFMMLMTASALPGRRPGRGTVVTRGIPGDAQVNVKLRSPSFSIEVTSLSPGLNHTCLSLG
jgi:hypothetical protein